MHAAIQPVLYPWINQIHVSLVWRQGQCHKIKLTKPTNFYISFCDYSPAALLYSYKQSCSLMHKYPSSAHVGYVHTHPLLGVQTYRFTCICSGRCGYSSFMLCCSTESTAPHNPLIHMPGTPQGHVTHLSCCCLLHLFALNLRRFLTVFCREAAPHGLSHHARKLLLVMSD